MGGQRWNGGAWGPNKGGGGNGGGARSGWVDYGGSKAEQQLDAQIAKMEKKIAELTKNNTASNNKGLWESGNPHLTAWACQCGFQNFKSRTACMKCKAKQPVGGGVANAVPEAAATAGAAQPAGSKPDEELAYWQGQLRAFRATAAGPGKTQLVELAESKVAELTRQVRACRPLPARFQAAEARLQEAAKAAKAAVEAAVALEKQLRAALEAMKAADAKLEQATVDLEATRLELVAPAAPPSAKDPALLIQQVLEKLVGMGLVQVPAVTPGTLQAALGAVVLEVLSPKDAPAMVDPIPVDAMDIDGEAALAACQQGGPAVCGGPGAAPAAEAGATATAATATAAAVKVAQAAGEADAKTLIARALAEAQAQLPPNEGSGEYGACKEPKSCSRGDPMGR
jgi:hypothetical protein